MEPPITLKVYRERMQAFIDSGDRDGAKKALKILNDNGVSVQATQESEDDKRERIKSVVVPMIKEKYKTISPMEANRLFDDNYTKNDSVFSLYSKYK